MQVKIIAKCFTGSGKNMFPGEQVDLADSTAARLIRAGFAEEAQEVKPRHLFSILPGRRRLNGYTVR